MLKTAVIITGILGLLMGVFMGVIITLSFIAEISAPYYFFSYSNTLSAVAKESIVLIANIFLCLGGIQGGLLLLFPVKVGRLMHVAGYTTPDEEVVSKSYRGAGIIILIGGIATNAIHYSIVREGIVLLPLLAVILGIAALVASFKVKY
jgi:hypothetical protein